MLAGAVVCSAQSTFYFPQIADGQQGGGIFWKTTIYISNPAAIGTANASGVITFAKDDGSAFNLSFVDEAGNLAGGGNQIQFQIGGGQTRRYVSSGAPPLATGYAPRGSRT